jgi:hypothetical protein
MTRPESLWTAAPHVDPWYPQYEPEYAKPTAMPFASDNDAERKVLIYGPKGQPLVEQRPRPIGFRDIERKP